LEASVDSAAAFAKVATFGLAVDGESVTGGKIIEGDVAWEGEIGDTGLSAAGGSVDARSGLTFKSGLSSS
jgi:hypothetical protein